MKQHILSWLHNIQQRTGFYWGGGEIIVAGILIVGILSLGSGMFGKWIRASREGGLLMVDLHSFSAADYGVDEMPVSVPAIGLEIIQDLLGMNAPPETGRPAEIALVTPRFPSPTPTLPWSGTLVWTSTPEASEPAGSTPTSEHRESATPAAIRSQTPTAIPTQQPPSTVPPQFPTNTPYTSPTNPAATKTSQPTSMPPTVIPATNTPAPTALPPPTNTPQPTPTSQPISSPTPRPTRSSTLAVTPTAKYTPAVTSGPPPIP